MRNQSQAYLGFSKWNTTLWQTVGMPTMTFSFRLPSNLKPSKVLYVKHYSTREVKQWVSLRIHSWTLWNLLWRQAFLVWVSWSYAVMHGYVYGHLSCTSVIVILLTPRVWKWQALGEVASLFSECTTRTPHGAIPSPCLKLYIGKVVPCKLCKACQGRLLRVWWCPRTVGQQPRHA